MLKLSRDERRVFSLIGWCTLAGICGVVTA